MACDCEPTAIRVSSFGDEDGYGFQFIGQGTAGRHIGQIPRPSTNRNIRHVFDWHPHPGGSPYPSASDLTLSAEYGTANVIQYRRNSYTYFYGSR